MGYIAGIYKVQFIIVLIAIVQTSIGQVVAIMEMRYLIDDYITPFIGQENPVLSELFSIIAIMATAYAITVVCSWLYNRLMINISQGVMKKVRDEMFAHMQTLDPLL